MKDDSPIYEPEIEANELDPDEIPIKDRHVYTQPYDLVVKSLIDQIKGRHHFPATDIGETKFSASLCLDEYPRVSTD